MKLRAYKLLFIFSILSIYRVNAQETKNPFSFETIYLGDFAYNSLGGVSQGFNYLGLANIRVNFNTEEAGFWKGGDLLLCLANTHGGEPSLTRSGEYQTASNIEAGNITYLHELWFKQSIKQFDIIIGLQDICEELIFSEHADIYLNSSFGTPPTIAENIPSPIFPLTALGLQVHYNIRDKFFIKMAAFDGVPDDFSINKYNTSWKLSKKDGFLSLFELSYANESENNSGIYKLGAYYHNKYTITEKEEGVIISENHPQNYGVYAVIDQTLYKKNESQELSMFTQLAISPKNINENWLYAGIGFNYRGLFKNRSEDILGLALAYAEIDSEVGSEALIELTYKSQLNDNFFIQPNIQYFINPSGTESKLKNPLLFFVRLGLEF